MKDFDIYGNSPQAEAIADILNAWYIPEPVDEDWALCRNTWKIVFSKWEIKNWKIRDAVYVITDSSQRRRGYYHVKLYMINDCPVGIIEWRSKDVWISLFQRIESQRREPCD